MYSSTNKKKRDNEQSPIKKRFKDAAISKEELDVAIANRIKLALQEQLLGLDVVVATAVREAVDSILVPALRDLRTEFQKTNATVKEISSELEIVAKSTKRTQDRVDSVQAAAREDRRAVLELRTQLDQLTTKLTDLEDSGRRNNSPRRAEAAQEAILAETGQEAIAAVTGQEVDPADEGQVAVTEDTGQVAVPEDTGQVAVAEDTSQVAGPENRGQVAVQAEAREQS
ncbi:hypothetical protein DPEC_G00093470 [Dallia pectoralis]|uniref:Uncharacterized protein n=1 Tax=Dallia pectoralis TaxID=75939 RepID=A0ACC2H0T4_DALPE|nr:hypothetical protein DPEC_G00093470 [Dallia pectoralis]